MKNQEINKFDEAFERNGHSQLIEDEASNLRYNEDENSYELDVELDDPDYQHLDPYDTAVPNGEDISSTYDEANPYMAAEYQNHSLEDDLTSLGMHTATEEDLKLSRIDAELSRTPEDYRDDLDDEGYPKNMD